MNSTMLTERDGEIGQSLMPNAKLRLQRAAGELVFCGGGPTAGSLSYLDAASGAVVVLFLARLRSVGATFAFFDPENEALRAAGKSASVAVRTQDVHGVIHVESPAVVGPVSMDGNGYLDGAGAWPL
jgi:hypothetical protein